MSGAEHPERKPGHVYVVLDPDDGRVNSRGPVEEFMDVEDHEGNSVAVNDVADKRFRALEFPAPATLAELEAAKAQVSGLDKRCESLRVSRESWRKKAKGSSHRDRFCHAPHPEGLGRCRLKPDHKGQHEDDAGGGCTLMWESDAQLRASLARAREEVEGLASDLNAAREGTERMEGERDDVILRWRKATLPDLCIDCGVPYEEFAPGWRCAGEGVWQHQCGDPHAGHCGKGGSKHEAESARLRAEVERLKANWGDHEPMNVLELLDLYQSRASRLEKALLLTDLHLSNSGPPLLIAARKAGIEVPRDRLWPQGDLDQGAVNAWVKEVRAAALASTEGAQATPEVEPDCLWQERLDALSRAAYSIGYQAGHENNV